jgi:cbb3-type cytochrome oxidase maturation protein
MSVIFIALPVALGLAIAALVGFAWATREGQFDDLDTPPVRMLFDDPPGPGDRRP